MFRTLLSGVVHLRFELYRYAVTYEEEEDKKKMTDKKMTCEKEKDKEYPGVMVQPKK